VNISDLHEASYRGAFFYISRSEIAGGRKDAKKEFIDSDLQTIEDLGKKQQIFTVNGTISERRDNSGNIISTYGQVRNTLVDALEKGGTGILVHPWIGRIENIVCRSFSLSEDVKRLGDGQVSMVFEISNTTGIPKANPFVLTNIATGNAGVITKAISIFEAIWGITDFATGNFQAAIDKADNFVDAVNAATNPLTTLSSKINEHTSLVSNFSSSTVSLISSSSDLSISIGRVLASINSLYSTPTATLIAFSNLFDFGDGDISSPYSTLISLERKSNSDVFNSTVKSIALSYSYLNASQIEYKTVEEINEAELALEDQYQNLFLDETVDPELLSDVTDLRTITQGFFNTQKLTASQIITIQTNPTSVRLLAFNYYGESTDGEAIAELNDLYDMAFFQGDIRIFTA
jgi:hypothetical protein